MSTPSRVRLIDIADALDVSKVTVSKALRNHPDISKEMTQRVKDKAEEMGYRPNKMAQVLSSRQSCMIGVVLPEITHSFFAAAMDGIYRAAAENCYEIILTVSREDPVEETANLQHLMSMHVDGILIAPSHHTVDTSVYEEVKSRKIPLVFFDRYLEKPEFSRVTVDDHEAAKKIVTFAIEKGYTEIAHFAGYAHRPIFRRRLAGYKEALKEAGRDLCPDCIIECGVTEEDGYRAMKQLQEKDHLPDAVFCVNDLVACGVYKAARELGLVIPGQLAVLGYSGASFTEYLSPPLTTIDQNAEKLGAAAFQMVMERIQKPNTPKQVQVIPTELVIRESC